MKGFIFVAFTIYIGKLMLTRENHNSHNTSGLRTTGVQNYAAFVSPQNKGIHIFLHYNVQGKITSSDKKSRMEGTTDTAAIWTLHKIIIKIVNKQELGRTIICLDHLGHVALQGQVDHGQDVLLKLLPVIGVHYPLLSLLHRDTFTLVSFFYEEKNTCSSFQGMLATVQGE